MVNGHVPNAVSETREVVLGVLLQSVKARTSLIVEGRLAPLDYRPHPVIFRQLVLHADNDGFAQSELEDRRLASHAP